MPPCHATFVYKVLHKINSWRSMEYAAISAARGTHAGQNTTMQPAQRRLEDTIMSTTQPIKSKDALNRFKNYYAAQKPMPRNNALIILGLNTALRISDILVLKWKDLYDSRTKTIKEHLEVTEQKTGKSRMIALNRSLRTSLKSYFEFSFQGRGYDKNQYLFPGRKGGTEPISRSQAYRIIRTAAKASGLEEHISCHSLRKTFGYHAWKQGTPPALLMDIYNHSSYSITKRYLSIEQDERDEVYLKILL